MRVLNKEGKTALKTTISMKFQDFRGSFRAQSLMVDVENPGDGPVLLLLGFCDE
jgi:hypothetical protein